MKPKHTPGPYLLVRTASSSKPEGPFVKRTIIYAGGWPLAEMVYAGLLAEARLFAAAPEMLEALNVALLNLEPVREDLGLPAEAMGIDQIKSAIAKAEGRDR